jgi:Bacterial PH domain
MLFVLIVVILLIATAVLLVTVRGARVSRFELSDAGLRLRGDLYGRMIPADSLRGGAARIVDLANTPELQPGWRRMGTALPGYRAGWFRLRNGEKALVYLTETSRTVSVPTRGGRSGFSLASARSHPRSKRDQPLPRWYVPISSAVARMCPCIAFSRSFFVGVPRSPSIASSA